MSIRRAPRPTNQFYLLDNRIAADERLSWQARGLLIYLLTKPDHWEVSVAQLIKQTQGSSKRTGRDGVYSIINELINAGYMRRTVTRDCDGGFDGTEYEVFESPKIEPPHTDNPETEAPPDTDSPYTDKPYPANPTQVSTEGKVSTDSKKTTCQKTKFSDDDMRAAKYMLDQILVDLPDYKDYNLKTWADHIRLMRERDGRTHLDMCRYWKWARKHHFWHKNILSPAKLRKQFDRLTLEMRDSHVKPNQRSGSALEDLIDQHAPELNGQPSVDRDDGDLWGEVDEPVWPEDGPGGPVGPDVE